MKVHVLGRYCGCPGPSGSCSGYLIEAGDQRILLDCGPGILGRLQTLCSFEELDAVVLTHLHADHCLDIVPLSYGLMARCQTQRTDRSLKYIPLYIPQGTRQVLVMLSEALGHLDFRFPPLEHAASIYQDFVQLLAGQDDFLFSLLPCVEYDRNGSIMIGDIRVSMLEMKHNVPTSGIRIEHENAVFAYSADTAICPQLVTLAQHADIFLCEATTTPDDADFYSFHMSAYEAGLVAKEAQVKQLVLTHISPWVEETVVIEEARREFNGTLHLAHEDDCIDVS